MMSHHCFHFYGPVTPKSVSNLRDQMLTALTRQEMTEGTLFLSSEGGDINSGFTAYNFIQALPVPFTAVNMGTVESIAVMLYLAADTRIAVKNSRFLLHSFHWGFPQTTVDCNRLTEHSLSLEFDQKRYADIFQERTQGAQAPVDIREVLRGEALILDPSAATSAGIASQIIDKGAISSADAHWWPAMF